MNESDIDIAQQVGDYLLTRDASLLRRIGCELVHIATGEATLRLTVTADMLNSGDVCQGGILFTLADQACAYACLADNRVGTTLSADIVYTNPAQLGDVLTAAAVITVDKRRVATCDVTVENQQGDPIALYRGIWYRKNMPVIELDEIG